ncbi:glycosyltransferase [Novosphingobium sp. YJ-S2-02]|uniref:Glycosyltransferase n=1 Tax=Novosphingobium aureum TaxID=2792964 RepID=A0A931MNC5_9SPHN|nr:glycosyltransferase family 1 protein [Novosphingobium aureum]MBH0115061.1 glycosyltransferase [Novosphingobium aureum]
MKHSSSTLAPVSPRAGVHPEALHDERRGREGPQRCEPEASDWPSPPARTGHERMRVMVEMRPALEGFAGIPQEVRLLFAGLRRIDELEVSGMLQTSHRMLSGGASPRQLRRNNRSQLLNRQSKVIVSLAETPFGPVIDRVARYLRRKLNALFLVILVSIGLGRIRLGHFDSRLFRDFAWRTLFDKTLPDSDFGTVASSRFRICSVPWHTMHLAGLSTLAWRKVALYPQLRSEDVDLFIAQTPYPGRISPRTRMIVRYHDAIPVLLPHTIPDKSIHQATHFHALQANVRAGAWFACVSEATRRDLLTLFPEAEARSVTIHNMVSPAYFPQEAAPEKVPGIIRARLHEGDAGKGVSVSPAFLTNTERENFYRRHLEGATLRYLLVVSTIEPRKNHNRLVSAWERIRAAADPDLKLVVVGGLGWDYQRTLARFSSWIERGQLFMLSAVPSPDLRVLYRNAQVTVCPSFAEGFDFSGVEAMRSGGCVIASDIAVHREVYDDAALYFSPYSTGALVDVLARALEGEAGEARRADLRRRGEVVARRYLPEAILPRWRDFLRQMGDKP